jgi:hypothetical protein
MPADRWHFQAVNQRIGQLDNQPQQADTQPQQPIARMQQRRKKFK